MSRSTQYDKTRGQSLVETALTLPLLLLLIFTFLDLGRAVYYYSAVGNAVREGARFASVQPQLDTTSGGAHETAIIAVVTGYSVAVPISAGNVNVDRSDADGTVNADGDYVFVAASFEFDPVTPFLEKAFGSPGNTITLTSESTMFLAPVAR